MKTILLLSALACLAAGPGCAVEKGGKCAKDDDCADDLECYQEKCRTEHQVERRKAREAEDERLETILATPERLRDAMCACKDIACAQPVFEKLTAFEKQHADTKVTRAENERITKAVEELVRCHTEALDVR